MKRLLLRWMGPLLRWVHAPDPGGGGLFPLPDRKGRFEHRHSHEWAGETLVERYKLRVHRVDLTFERRMTFSADRSELKVSERIIGPAGEDTHELSLPLA
jgi:hypothetical protein